MDTHNHMDNHMDLTSGIRQNNLRHFLENGGMDKDFVIYNVNTFSVISYDTWVPNYTDNKEELMGETCSMLPIWEDICKEEPSACQLAEIEKDNLQGTVDILIHSMFAVNGPQPPHYGQSNGQMSQKATMVNWYRSH